MYVIYIGSDKIRIVEAKTSFGKIKISSLYSAIAPNDYLDNPNDKSFNDLSNVIAQGLLELGGKDKRVRVVLENGTIPFTQKEIKTLPDNKVINLIRNEIFSDEKLSETNVVDFVEVERFYKEEIVTEKEQNEKWVAFLGKKPQNKKPVNKSKLNSISEEEISEKEKKPKTKKVLTSRVFFTYISKTTIKHLEKLFKDIGYKLLSIDIYQNSMRKLIKSYFFAPSKNKGELPKNMMLVEYKEDAITEFLFKDNKLAYTFRKNLSLSFSEQFGKKQETSFLNELGDTIKESLQFFRSMYQNIEFDRIYLTGVIENFDSWKDSLTQRIAYDVDILKTPNAIHNVDDIEFNEFSGAIAGFITNGGLL